MLMLFVIVLIVLMMVLLTIIWDYETVLWFTLFLVASVIIALDLLKLSYRVFKRCYLKRKVNKLRQLKKQMKVQKLLKEYEPETDGAKFETTGSNWSLMPTFFKTLIRPKTRHNELFKIALITMFGMLYTVLCFYQQILLFEKMTTATVILVLGMMFVSVVLPISWKLGILFALLLIPSAIVITMRAGVIKFLAFDLQTATRTNIEINGQSLLDAFSCELKQTREFGRKLKSVGFKGSDREIELNMANPFEFIKNAIERFVEKMQEIVKWIEEKVKSIKRFFKMLKNLFENIFKYLGYYIGRFLTSIFNFLLGGLIARIVETIKGVMEEIYKVIKRSIKTLKDEIIERVKAEFRVDLHDTYIYRLIRSKPNISFAGIYGQVFRKFVLRHPYLLFADEAMRLFAMIFAFWIFFIIFIPPIRYIYNFRRSPSFDNNYIDKHLEEYDKEIMESGKAESLFPLDFYERLQFIPRTTWRIILPEISRTFATIIVDAAMILYVIISYSLDTFMYYAVYSMNSMSKEMMEWLLPRGGNFLGTIHDLKMVNVKKLMKSYESFRVNLMDCLPTPSPTDTWMYGKCLINLIFLIIFAMIRPYVNRTKSWLCSRYFPHMNRPRAINLYNRILLFRLIVKGALLMLPPGYAAVLPKQITGRKKIEKKKTEEKKEIDSNESEKKKKGGPPGIPEYKQICVICSKQLKTQELYFACATPNCPANFCEECLYTPPTDNLNCPYCGKDINDMGDDNFSIEKDSSFEELDDWMGGLE